MCLCRLTYSNFTSFCPSLSLCRLSPSHVLGSQTVGPSPKISTIPRIRFRFKILGGASFEVTRTQFPLRLAYCMTYNKAQGQTLQCVLLDITSPPFAHGHLYVALSRVTHYANIKVFCNEKFICDDAPLLSNIVYPELLPD
jgi:hypothetical protein